MVDQEKEGYEKQEEVGKQFIKETLATLATRLKQPDIDKFEFLITDQDFDRDQVSIFDPKNRKVVTKLARNDLADCSTTPVVRRKLGDEVDTAVQTYYATKKK
jgi:hypothetical protein